MLLSIFLWFGSYFRQGVMLSVVGIEDDELKRMCDDAAKKTGQVGKEGQGWS